MKRIILAIGIMFLTALYVFSEQRGTKPLFLLTAKGDYLIPRDDDFKEIYGNAKIYPEINASLYVYKSFYIWAGYGYLSAEGVTSVLQLEAKSSQHFFSMGGELLNKISALVDFSIGGGLVIVNYKEEAMGEELADSAIGFRFDGGLILNISRNIFAKISAGYLSASGTVENYSVKLGGFQTGLGLGIKL